MGKDDEISAAWQVALPILAFLLGASLLVYDGILDPPADAITSGFGLILTGLGPAALIDVIRRDR